jgi:hypothetical protein
MWNIEFFHTLHARRRGSSSNRALERCERLLRPFGDHLDGAIW